MDCQKIEAVSLKLTATLAGEGQVKVKEGSGYFESSALINTFQYRLSTANSGSFRASKKAGSISKAEMRFGVAAKIS